MQQIRVITTLDHIFGLEKLILKPCKQDNTHPLKYLNHTFPEHTETAQGDWHHLERWGKME